MAGLVPAIPLQKGRRLHKRYPGRSPAMNDAGVACTNILLVAGHP